VKDVIGNLQYRTLGQTGIKVSRLCFGALTIGPLQTNLSVREGARVVAQALAAGVNFIDTAELYYTYPYISEALKQTGGDAVIVSKSYAYTGGHMAESLAGALRELNRDYVDVFLLHEQESKQTIKGHWEALEYLIKAKEKGLVRAVGLSTHHVAGVLDAATIPEIDVIHPLINLTGIGIKDGTVDDMRRAITLAHAAGKGLYAMKALGGGHLLARKDEAFRYILAIPELAAVAVGMSSLAEVDYNTRVFAELPVEAALAGKVARQPRRLLIDEWCQGCGACVAGCKAGALRLAADGRAAVTQEACTLCGYCAPLCPEFFIKVV
jgi:aryl-alcohol dehydrogenase-like predicted oxidoreductase/NAD-dependent dihydropyrimidine dehydrogenase PreA subunit